MYLKDEKDALERLHNPENLFALLNPGKSNRIPKLKLVKEPPPKPNIIVPDEVLVPRGKKKNGRKLGSRIVPNLVKEMAGAAAHFTDPKVIAEELGLTPQQVRLYRKGQTVNGKSNPQLEAAVQSTVKEIQSAIDTKMESVRSKAVGKLSDILDAIGPDKLADAKLREITSAARNVSDVIENVSPVKKRSSEDDSHGARIFVYSPQPKEESDYDHVKIRSRDRR